MKILYHFLVAQEEIHLECIFWNDIKLIIAVFAHNQRQPNFNSNNKIKLLSVRNTFFFTKP